MRALLFFCCTITAFAQNAWVQQNDFPLETFGRASFVLQDEAYVVTKNVGDAESEMYRYNESADTWTFITALPNGYLAPFVLNDLVYFPAYDQTGNQSVDLWEYDVFNDVWVQKNDVVDEYFTFGDGSMHTYVVNGEVYILFPGKEPDDFYKYDAIADTWTAVAQHPAEIDSGVISFSIGDKAYTVFGDQDIGQQINSLWEYDTTGDVWAQKEDFPSAFRTHPAAFVINDLAYVGTGYYGSPTNVFYRYDPFADAWELIEQCGYKTERSFSFVVNGYGYIGVGGKDNGAGGATPQNEVWRLDPDFLSVDAFAKADVNIYPNPVIDQISIETTEEIETLRLFNMLGQVVIQSSTLTVLNTQIPNVRAGMYVLQVTTTDQKTGTYRLLKQ